MCEMFDQGDQCAVFSDTSRRARKEHVCDSCCVTIAKGEKYFKHFNVFDGAMTSEKCCATCKADRVVFAAAPGHVDCSPSDFVWFLDGCVNGYPSDYELSAEDLVWKAMMERINAGRTVYNEKRKTNERNAAASSADGKSSVVPHEA